MQKRVYTVRLTLTTEDRESENPLPTMERVANAFENSTAREALATALDVDTVSAEVCGIKVYGETFADEEAAADEGARAGWKDGDYDPPQPGDGEPLTAEQLDRARIDTPPDLEPVTDHPDFIPGAP